jgi:hypothetical protein
VRLAERGLEIVFPSCSLFVLVNRVAGRLSETGSLAGNVPSSASSNNSSRCFTAAASLANSRCSADLRCMRSISPGNGLSAPTSGTPNQDSGDKHKHSADEDLDCGWNQRRIHIPVAYPGD